MTHGCRILLALILGLMFVGPARARMVERIVAVVNNEVVLLSELNERLQSFAPQLQQIADPALRQQRLEELRQQMLKMMIDEELIKYEARELKITVSDKDLELAIADVMRKNNLTREQLDGALRQEGKDIASYKETILRPQLLRLRVLNVRVRSRINVGEEEILAQYQKNMRALGVETKVRARHIFVAIPQDAGPAQIDERKRYALSLLAKIKGGEKFEEVARKFSQDSVTRGDGGDLGFFSRGTLPPSVEEVVFNMKAGEIRGPLLGERGFHLIQLVDRQESSARKLDEVKDELREQLYMQKMEKATQAWLQEVRKRSHIDIKL
jgi:peptidyl-prolyl cis-trans isomerase SurA